MPGASKTVLDTEYSGSSDNSTWTVSVNGQIVANDNVSNLQQTTTRNEVIDPYYNYGTLVLDSSRSIHQTQGYNAVGDYHQATMDSGTDSSSLYLADGTLSSYSEGKIVNQSTSNANHTVTNNNVDSASIIGDSYYESSGTYHTNTNSNVTNNVVVTSTTVETPDYSYSDITVTHYNSAADTHLLGA